jgi:hypothetical protein
VPRAAAARPPLRRSSREVLAVQRNPRSQSGSRESLRILVQRAREQRTMAFLFVNNRLEGNSPLTIMAVTEPD